MQSRASKIKNELKKSDKFVRFFELPNKFKKLNRDEINNKIETIIDELKSKGVWK